MMSAIDDFSPRAAPMNLHVLVPDLFLTADPGAEPSRGLALPALETLLARGAARRIAGASLEDWLAAAFSIRGEPDRPFAPLSLLGEGLDPGEDTWLRADPVHIEARGDHLFLADSTSLDIDAAEAASLIAALNAHFASDGIEFVAPHPRRWYVRSRARPRLRTTPTSEAARRPVRDVLPQGEDAPRWRSTLNEAQMLLHGHPCNEARELRGARTVNGIWFWGAGRAPRLGNDAPYGMLWTAHPLAAGIAAAAGLEVRPLPAGGGPELAAVAAGGTPQLLVLDNLTTAFGAGAACWQAELLDLEKRWFAPLLAGLFSGVTASLTLHCLGRAGGRQASLTRWAPFKLWRARHKLSWYAT